MRFTMACAACHSSQLFGKTVFGLSNRFPGANFALDLIKRITENTSSDEFAYAGSAFPDEVSAFDESAQALELTGVKKPMAYGLDSSISNVVLSFANRANQSTPKLLRAHLSSSYADSKPPVWWNVKYKDKFLADGAVTAGNPVLMFLLWNEVIRGSDLDVFANWLSQNQAALQDMTDAVNSIEAPPISDFFPAANIDLNSAKRGQALFNQNCAHCHGTYEKAWDAQSTLLFTDAGILQTTKVNYGPTQVVDVGTDPNRATLGQDLTVTNTLDLAKANGLVVTPQKGYVPPPLVGIWARWPYFHNNSAPSLCAVLTRASDRPQTYVAGDPIDPATDFDFACNGYPMSPPSGWGNREFDTGRPGQSNSGHDEGIFLKNGVEMYSAQDKKDLIQFLQTL
jgi:hypothetical protein